MSNYISVTFNKLHKVDANAHYVINGIVDRL